MGSSDADWQGLGTPFRGYIYKARAPLRVHVRGGNLVRSLSRYFEGFEEQIARSHVPGVDAPAVT